MSIYDFIKSNVSNSKKKLVSNGLLTSQKIENFNHEISCIRNNTKIFNYYKSVIRSYENNNSISFKDIEYKNNFISYKDIQLRVSL